jgi:hypothetical protein
MVLKDFSVPEGERTSLTCHRSIVYNMTTRVVSVVHSSFLWRDIKELTKETIYLRTTVNARRTTFAKSAVLVKVSTRAVHCLPAGIKG